MFDYFNWFSYVLKEKNEQKEKRMSEYKCPHCGMIIFDEDALLCHSCGESLERAGKGFLGRIRYSNQKVVLFFLTFAVLLSFVALMVIYN